MEILSKGNGIWQAGGLWIAKEEGRIKESVHVELMDPLADWAKVYASFCQCMTSKGRFLSLSLGFPEDYHAIRTDLEKSNFLGYGLNVRLLIEIAERFLTMAKAIQRLFPVTEAKEYTLQADLESYFHEIESPLYQMRIASLKALEEKGALEGYGMEFEKDRAVLSVQLKSNFHSQAEILNRVSSSAEVVASLSQELVPFKALARKIALVDRGVEALPIQEKLDAWMFVFDALGWKPLLVGDPEDHAIQKLLKAYAR
jgi:signal transduction histidine kinase